MPSLGLASKHVRHVHLDERHVDCDERVAERETRMAVRTGVDDSAVDTPPQRLNVIDERTLTVLLGEFQINTQLSRDDTQASLDVRERLVPIQRGLARAQQVQVWTVENGDPHRFFRPWSQALNCSMSSDPDVGGVDVGAPWSLGALADDDWEKN